MKNIQKTKLIIFFALSLISPLLSAQPTHLEPQGNKKSLSLDIQKMAFEDQLVREDFERNPQSSELVDAMMIVDEKHNNKIEKILKMYSWPSKADIGKDGVRSMWILVQHGSKELLHKSIPLMQQAAKTGDLPWHAVATSIDRDLINYGKKQRYGTQFKIVKNKLILEPLENAQEVDRLRKTVGLNSLAEYHSEMLKTYKGLK